MVALWTKGTLANIMRYAENKRQDEQAEERRRKEEEAREERNRVSKLGKEFLNMLSGGKDSPEDFNRFVQERNLSSEDFIQVADLSARWLAQQQKQEPQRVTREEVVPGQPGQRRIRALAPGETYTPVPAAGREPELIKTYEDRGRSRLIPKVAGAVIQERPEAPARVTPPKPVDKSTFLDRRLRTALGYSELGGITGENAAEYRETTRIAGELLRANPEINEYELLARSQEEFKVGKEKTDAMENLPAPDKYGDIDKVAQEKIDNAIALGNDPADIAAMLKGKGWSEERINKALPEGWRPAIEAPTAPTTPTPAVLSKPLPKIVY